MKAYLRYLNPLTEHPGDVRTIKDWASLLLHTTEHQVAVRDARGLDWDLDVCGFVNVTHSVGALDFSKREMIERDYYESANKLVRHVARADIAFPYEHFVRWGKSDDFVNGYARFLHGDKIINQPMRYMQDKFDEFGLDWGQNENWSFSSYNTWQPIENVVVQYPLALIDARSIDTHEISTYLWAAPDNVQMEIAPIFSTAHEIYFFSDLRPDEMLIFKQLDTRPNRAITCLHSAFYDPSAPDVPRKSIEVRWLCAHAGR